MRTKLRTIGEIAVMELPDVEVQKKRRRLNDDEEDEYNKLTSPTTPYIQLRGGRILLDNHHQRDKNRYVSAFSDHDDDVCCSSNIGCSDKRIIELPDLEQDESIEVEISTHINNSESYSMTEATHLSKVRAESEDIVSTWRYSETNSDRGSKVEKMPTEADLEEFFAPAEKKLQKQFAQRYNYDIVKDKPLEGRYEWARL